MNLYRQRNVAQSSSLKKGDILLLGNDGENLALLEEHNLVLADADVGAAKLGEEDALARLQARGDHLARRVVDAAGADGEDGALVELGGRLLRQKEAGCRLLFFLALC